MNWHDTKAIVPVLRELADGGFQGPALGDLGYQGQTAGRGRSGHSASPSRLLSLAAETDSSFPHGDLRWVVERSFAWLSRYRRG